MALIKCCECSNEVSEYAENCPKCGCPVSISKDKIAEVAKEAEQKKAEQDRLDAEKAAEKEKKREDRSLKLKANKKKIIIISCIFAVLLCIAVVCGVYYGYILPHNAAFNEYTVAVEDYNALVNAHNEAINGLTSHIEETNAALATAKSLLESGGVPYDENTLDQLAAAADTLDAESITLPESTEELTTISVSAEDRELTTKELLNKSSELKLSCDALTPDLQIAQSAHEALTSSQHLSLIENLIAAIANFENSVKVELQITNPSEEFILTRLESADFIVNFAPVTEDHDPNGHLHKPGGYTAAIYFTHTYLSSSLLGADLIEEGTDAGGCIEVFASKEDAEKRNTYLGAFDGTILDNGSHVVIGSIVIRTSSELTASNQQALTQELIDLFTLL